MDLWRSSKYFIIFLEINENKISKNKKFSLRKR